MTEIKVKSILFVDDIEAICCVFKNLVELRCGAKVTTCNSGKEALALLKQYHFDVVVTDIIMPDMDGIQLTEIILMEFDVPVVLTTAYNKDELPSGFDNSEAVCCISKPYTVSDIQKNIYKALRKKAGNGCSSCEDYA